MMFVSIGPRAASVPKARLPPVPDTSGAATGADSRISELPQDLVIAATLLCIVVLIQLAVGAYASERSSYSDEASHFMNALLVKDYILDGHLQNPIHFAEQYYLSYPKIAPGMWPPLFATTVGFAMIFIPSPHAATFLVLAIVNAWVMWRLYRFVLLTGSRHAAAFLSAILFLIPGIVDLASAAMVDLFIVATALEATYWLARFFVTGETRHGVLFGLFSTLCCLTKGNGLALALVPPFLAVFTRRYDPLARRELWIVAAVVAAVAGPPMFLSLRLDAAIGDFGWPGFHDVTTRLFFYAVYGRRQFGVFVAVVSLIGLASAIRHGRQSVQSEVSIHQGALAALVAAVVAFHLLNPHMMVAFRYITPALPALIGLIPAGIKAIVAWVPGEFGRRCLEAAMLLAVPAAFIVSPPAFSIRLPVGARETVDFIERTSGLASVTAVVISDEHGEGAIVSEVARRHPTPRATVIRGSKLIAADDWAGNRFRMLYESPDALRKELEDLHVDYLVMDYSKEASRVRFWSQVCSMIDSNGERLVRAFTAGGERQFVTYRMTYHTAGPPKPLVIPLPYSLGRVLRH